MKLPSLTAAGEQWRQWQARDTLEEALGHAASATLNIVSPVMAKRDTTSTCSPGDNSTGCTKPADSTNMQTLAIALGVCIPLGCAVVVLFFLHRRHLKKQRLEDLNDPHKSLDFGMSGPMPKGKGYPEMTVADLGSDPAKSSRRPRGLSMDMGSPYLLPSELHGSRASLRSMSRSMRDDSDPYRPVTLIKGEYDSIRGLRMNNEKGSLYSAATSMQSSQENSGLIANARPMSQSFPKRGDSTSHADSTSVNERSATRSRAPSQPSSNDKPLPTPSPNATNLADFVPPPPPPPPEDKPQFVRPPRTSSVSSAASRPGRKESSAAIPPVPSVPSIVVPTPEASKALDLPPQLPSVQSNEYDIDPSMIYTGRYSLDGDDHAAQPTMLAHPQPQTNRMSIVGVRPLPTDLPEDNPEQRANRIRSFYKEYFDDRRPNPQGQYVDDYDPSYLADYTVYDPSSGGFLTASNAAKPWAQPVGRRAMTPPPRGAAPGSPFGDHRRHMSTQSTARLGPRGRGPAPPKKRLPPPSALVSLPTPHMLRNDSSLFNSLDFAPPTSFRDRQAGRAPDSPLGVQRPYSPSVAPFNPLVTAYDELASVPSPHLLRKSGTFTGLDFAPPPRFREGGNASDAGSIRSNRSGISAMQQEAIRAGAYRVSRIPTAMVSTKEDIANQLKPTWNMRRGSNIMG